MCVCFFEKFFFSFSSSFPYTSVFRKQSPFSMIHCQSLHFLLTLSSSNILLTFSYNFNCIFPRPHLGVLIQAFLRFISGSIYSDKWSEWERGGENVSCVMTREEFEVALIRLNDNKAPTSAVYYIIVHVLMTLEWNS